MVNAMLRKVFAIGLLCAAADGFAMGGREPLAAAVLVDELEIQERSGGSAQDWEIAAMAQRDLSGLWLVSEGKRAGGRTHEHELRGYFSRAVAPYWDVTLGWRGDLGPGPERHWLAAGIDGVAPFHVDTALTLFVGDEGRSALRVKLAKELMVTQRWQLLPEITANFHGHNDPAAATGSGLSSLEAEVRLAYRVTPAVRPYIGLGWSQRYGRTADYQRLEGNGVEGGQVMLGIRFWL